MGSFDEIFFIYFQRANDVPNTDAECLCKDDKNFIITLFQCSHKTPYKCSWNKVPSGIFPLFTMFLLKLLHFDKQWKFFSIYVPDGLE